MVIPCLPLNYITQQPLIIVLCGQLIQLRGLNNNLLILTNEIENFFIWNNAIYGF